MKGVRRNLGVILAALGGVITYLASKTVVSDGWEHWGFMTGVVVSGIVATGVALVFASTFLTTTGDPWSTSWFRLMRKFWGDSFGGPEKIKDPTTGEEVPRRLQVSLCRAVNLSAIALMALAAIAYVIAAVIGFLVGSVGVAGYLAVVGAIYGIDTPLNFLWTSNLEMSANMLRFLFCGGIFFPLIATIAMLLLTEFLGDIMKKSATVKKKAWLAYGGIVGLNSILIFLVVPMRTLGVLPVLTWVGIVLGGIVGLVLAIALLVITIWVAIRLSKAISHGTVPGVLALGRVDAFKKRVCPPIIEGPPSTI